MLRAEWFNTIRFGVSVSFGTSKQYTIIRILIQTAKALLPLGVIAITSRILDILSSPNAINAVLSFSALLILLCVFQIILQLINKVSEYVQQLHDAMLDNFLLMKVLNKTANIDMSFYDSPSYYDRLQHTKINSVVISQMIWNIFDLIACVIAFSISFIVLYKYSALFALVILVSYIPLILYDQVFIKKIYSWQRENLGNERRMSYLSDIITQRAYSNNSKHFGIFEYFIGLYIDIWKFWFSSKKAILQKKYIGLIFLGIIPQLITIFILYNLGLDIIHTTRTIGDFALYSGIISQMISNLFIIVYLVTRISECKMHTRDFVSFLKWGNAVEETGTRSLENISSIEFKNVSFSYPKSTDNILKNLCLRFNADEHFAIVGINGAGKTTIIKLLLRFYDPTEGTILINGIDIKEYTPSSIRNCFSVLFQDYINYAFKIRENITISDLLNKDCECEIADASDKSGVSKMIKNMEKGVDTYLYKTFEDNGKELSGGENQKISLARTFFRERDIMILDEPSAHLDPESEMEMFKKIIKHRKNKGLILITHRISNIVHFNRIIVLENGIIEEDGTHEELMHKNGRYSQMFKIQSKNFLSDVE